MATNDYQGVIIEESLKDKRVLKELTVVSTDIEPVTEQHKTPWLKQWTLHAFTIPESGAGQLADALSRSLGPEPWYADFKNDSMHYIIFPGKVFKIDRTKQAEYQAATDFGLTLGIPSYQLDFSPHIKQWERPEA